MKTWSAEIAPPKYRGAVVEMHALGFILGYAIQGWIGLGFYFWTAPVTWRLPLAFQSIFPIFLLAGLYWLPESPRFLMMKGRVEEAKRILVRVHQAPKEEHSLFVAAEILQMAKQIELDRKQGATWVDMIWKPANRKRCILTAGMTWAISSTGILVINSK
jgi:MFS family permease